MIRWKDLALVMTTALCIGITLGLFPSLIALNVEYRGYETTWNGLLAAMPALAGILVGPVAPRIVAKLGALQTYLVASAISISAICLFPLIPGLGSWFLLRFAMGVGMGVQWIVSEMWVNRLAAGPRRGTVLGIYVFVLSIGLTAGPFLMNMLGSRGIASFYAAAAIQLGSCLPLFFAAGAANADTVETTPLAIVDTLARNPQAMLAGVVDGFVFQTFMIFLALYFLRLGTEETTAVGFLTLFFFGGVLLQFAIGYLLDRVSPRTVLIGCGILILAGLSVMAAVRDIPLLIFPTLLALGGASAAVYTSALACISDSFSAEEMPSGTATFTVLWFVGGLAGPVAAGRAMDWWNPHGMAIVVGLAAAVLVTVNLVASRKPGPRL